MEASYNKLQEYFDEKLPTADKVAEALTLHSYEVENIEEVGGDYILYIDVLPNRASDSSDEYGIVRELSAILNIKLKRLGNPITKWSEIKINISVSEINKLLGSNISIKEIENIFNRLGFKFDLNGEWFVVNPPYERKDLELKADVIEEVGRIYGYKNIEAMLPEKPKKAPRINKKFYYITKIKNFLVDEGFSEVFTYTFRDSGEVEMIKPFASDKNFLRKDLRTGLAIALRQNIKNIPLLEGNEIKIFEIGNVFSKNEERASLGIGYSENSKFINDTINKLSGFLCVKINGETTKNIFETNLDELLGQFPEPPNSYEPFEKTKDVAYSPISPYPFMLRDIAVWIPSDKTSDDVLNVIKEQSGGLLVNTKLFDEFKKDDKVSYAFNLIFQSQEKTLSDEEINEVMYKVTGALNANLNWEVR